MGGAASRLLGRNVAPFTPRVPFAYDYVVDLDLAPGDDLKRWALKAQLESAREQLRAVGKVDDVIHTTLECVGFEALPEKLAELFWSVKAKGSPTTWVVHKNDGEASHGRSIRVFDGA